LPATREAPATESVTIRTLFQTALEARIPSGGGVAVWNKAVDANEKTYLLLISPAIQPKPRPKN
jgi:hypothetical protein